LSYLTWEWCLSSNDPRRGQLRFPCLVSRTLSSARTAAAQGRAFSVAAAEAAIPRLGEGGCSPCVYLEKQLLHEVCWE